MTHTFSIHGAAIIGITSMASPSMVVWRARLTDQPRAINFDAAAPPSTLPMEVKI